MLPSRATYERRFLRADVVAGLTVWAVLVPESLAYATIAGVSPVVGLYAAVPSLLLYALIGSSRHLIVASMSATATLSASIVAGYAAAGTANYAAFTAALAIDTGLLGILFGLLRPPAFTGTIAWGQVDLGDDDHSHLIDPEAHLAAAMLHQ